MILFLDSVSSRAYIGLFTLEREPISDRYFDILGKESSSLLDLITRFLKDQNVSWEELEHIILVSGPGSFTGIRTSSLIINTIAYVHPHISLTPLSFFDLFPNFPIVKSSSKRDVFVKSSESATIEILSNQECLDIYSGQDVYGDIEDLRFSEKINILTYVDYTKIIKSVTLGNQKKVHPLYIKKPNIQ